MPFTRFPITTPRIAGEAATAKPIHPLDDNELIAAWNERIAQVPQVGGQDVHPQAALLTAHQRRSNFIHRSGSSYDGLQSRLEDLLLGAINNDMPCYFVHPINFYPWGWVRDGAVNWAAYGEGAYFGKWSKLDDLMRAAGVGGRLSATEPLRWTTAPNRAVAWGEAEGYHSRLYTTSALPNNGRAHSRRIFKEHKNETWKVLKDAVKWINIGPPNFPRVVVSSFGKNGHSGFAHQTTPGAAWDLAKAAWNAASWEPVSNDTALASFQGNIHRFSDGLYSANIGGTYQTLRVTLRAAPRLPIIAAKFGGVATLDPSSDTLPGGTTNYPLGGMKISETGDVLNAVTAFPSTFAFGNALPLGFSGTTVDFTVTDANDFSDPEVVRPPPPTLTDRGTIGGWGCLLIEQKLPAHVQQIGSGSSQFLLPTIFVLPDYTYV